MNLVGHIYIMNAIVFSVYILLLVFDSIASGFGYLKSGNHSRIKMSLYQVNHRQITNTFEEIQDGSPIIALWWCAELYTLLRTTTMQCACQNFKNCPTIQIRIAALLTRFRLAHCERNKLCLYIHK